MTTLDSRSLLVNDVIRQTAQGAELIVDLGHPFFFDHPLDHIPGLLLIEAGLQLAQQRAAPGQFVTSIDARFLKYALFNDPVILSTTTADHVTVVTLTQNDLPRATITVETAVYATPARQGPETVPEGLHPCEAAPLGKHHPENVLISTPQIQGSQISAWILPGRDDCPLTDTCQVIHPLHMLEAFMQVQRYINSQRLDKSRMRDILTGVSFRQDAPVQDLDLALQINGSTEFTETGRSRLSRDAVITRGGHNFAHCALHTVLAGRAAAKD